MSAARYQEIQDMREPRTKRSEFRSGKLEYRAPTKINVAPEPTYGRRHDDLSPMKLAIAGVILAGLFVIGLCWDTAPVHELVMFLRMQP